MNDDMREFMINVKGGLDRIEEKIDGQRDWMVRHAEEHAAMNRQRGAATVWGKLAALFAGIAVMIWPPTNGGH